MIKPPPLFHNKLFQVCRIYHILVFPSWSRPILCFPVSLVLHSSFLGLLTVLESLAEEKSDVKSSA
jgi:hypothetical protein